jgi:hypothetical protein
MRRKRALSVADIEAFDPVTLPFCGDWKESIGEPELTGSWLIWGRPGNGKTRFALMLAKYLSNFCRTAYDSVEEGLSLSIKKAIKEVGMREVKGNFLLLDKEPISDLRARLRRQRSPEAIVIDSIQYTGLTYSEYKKLRDEFPKKLFIFISHAEGKEPKGRVAGSVKYDAFVKIWVEGFKAYPMSRFGGGKEFVIWDKGAHDFMEKTDITQEP